MTRKRVRVDFREMPACTRPENYEYRRQARRYDFLGDEDPHDYDDPSLWDMPGNPADYGDR